MTASTVEITPVKGLVFDHATRTDWQGQPRRYTVTCVRSGKVHYRDGLGLKNACKVENFARFVGQVVSTPDPVEKTEALRLTASQCRALHAKAHEAGMAAGEAARPEPMFVVKRANPLDDTSPVVKRYAPVMDGVCGFAYVTIRPGNCSFARWIKKNARGFHAFYGGTQFSVHPFGQSLERKSAYASAYAEVLRAAGISAYPETRMD